MCRSSIIGGLILGIVIAIAPSAAARTAAVTMIDGPTLEGELLREAPDEVVIEIAGIETSIARDRIETIEIRPGIEQAYRQRRAELADDDLEGRYRLASDLFAQDQFDLAASELEDLTERFPQSQRVQRMLTVVQERQKLEQARRAPELPGIGPSAIPFEQVGPRDRLSQEDINRIKVWEMPANLAAAGTRVVVPPDVVNEFLDRYRERPGMPRDRVDQQRFRRAPGYQQLALIMREQARELYGRIRVAGDPPALQAIRSQLHRQYVLNYCGTSQCHGGFGAPGDFMVLRRQANSDATFYTNFYLMQAYRNNVGRMIDRDDPTRSLVLQYGLAREAAATPHPEVRGWRPLFFTETDPRFRQGARAIDALWNSPNYGVSFTLPTQGGEDGGSR